MKKFERIFIYSVLTILVFYVFLVDNNAESQVAIQEEIKARRIAIVNDAGQEVINLETFEGDGTISIFNKAGTSVVDLLVMEGGGTIVTKNKAGTSVAIMGAGVGDKGNGVISINNIYGNVIASMESSEDGSGHMVINNKDGNVITSMLVSPDGGGVIVVCNKYENPVVIMASENDNGKIRVFNKDGSKQIGNLP